MQKVLDQLVKRLTQAYGDRLVCVVLYGSAASGEHHGRYSDINILCVLKQVGAPELAAAGPIFHWWRGLGNPSPLLLSEEELRCSTDCFPIEFMDIRQCHRILYGPDLVADLEVDTVFYRAQVEHEMRAKLLRLRQKAGGVASDSRLLLDLMAESVSTFCVLTRHLLRLAGEDCDTGKRAAVSRAGERFGIDAEPFLALLDLREGKRKPKELNAPQMFEQYLNSVEALVRIVDRMER